MSGSQRKPTVTSYSIHLMKFHKVINNEGEDDDLFTLSESAAALIVSATFQYEVKPLINVEASKTAPPPF